MKWDKIINCILKYYYFYSIIALMNELNEIDKLIQSEEDRKKLLGLVPRPIEAREYFTPQNPAYNEIMRRTKDIQLLDFQAHAQYPVQAARSRFSVMGALRLGALGVRNAFRRSREAFGPVQFTPMGYESTWMSDVKLAGGYAEYPYNVRPGMAMAMGYESLAQRVARVPGVGMAAGASLATYLGVAAAVPGPAIVGIGAGIGAEMAVGQFMNPALRAQVTGYGNWLQQVDWRLKPGPAPTLRGVGFTATERTTAAYGMATMPYYHAGVTRPMVDIALRGGMEMGMYGDVGGAGDLTRRATEIATALRDVTRTLNQSFTEGMMTISQLRGAGVPYRQIGPMAGYISGAARTAGVPYAQMVEAGVVGAQMARAIRMPGATGVSAGMQAAWMAQSISRGGLMTQEQIAQVGGTEGIAQTLAYQATVGMRQKEVVRLIGAAYQRGGGLSREILDRYTAGSISSKEIGNLYQKNVLANKTAQYEFAENLPKLIGTLDPMTRLNIQMTAYQRQAKAAGLDITNRAAFTSFLRNMAVPNPEAVLAAAQITPQEMHGAIYSDIRHQERLDQAARGGPGLAAPFRAMGRAWRWRGKATVFWSQQQHARMEEKLVGNRMEALGIYDIGMEPVYEPGTAEYAKLYGRDVSTTLTYMTMYGREYETLRPTGDRGVGYAPTGELTRRTLGGEIRPMYPAGWRELSGLLKGERTRGGGEYGEMLDRGMSSITRARLSELKGDQRSGMIKDKAQLVGTSYLQLAAVSAAGPAVGIARLFGVPNLINEAYHKMHRGNVYNQMYSLTEAANLLSQDQYGVNFSQLQNSKKKKAVADRLDDMFNVRKLEMERLDYGELTAKAAKERKDKIARTWKDNIERGEAWGSQNRRFMQWMSEGNRWGRIITLAAQRVEATDPQRRKRLLNSIRAETGVRMSEFQEAGIGTGKINQYEIVQRMLDVDLFETGNRATEFLDMGNIQHRMNAMIRIKGHASKWVEKYGDEKGYELAAETMGVLSIHTESTPAFLKTVDVEGLKASPAYKKDKSIKLITDLAGSYQKLERLKKKREEGGVLAPTELMEIRKVMEETKKLGIQYPTLAPEAFGPVERGVERIKISEVQEALTAGIYRLGGRITPGAVVAAGGTIGEARTVEQLYGSAVLLKESVEMLHEKIEKISSRTWWR